MWSMVNSLTFPFEGPAQEMGYFFVGKQNLFPPCSGPSFCSIAQSVGYFIGKNTRVQLVLLDRG